MPRNETHIASDDQVVENAHDAPHCGRILAMVHRRTGEVNALAIAQKASGEQLVVDVQGRCTQVFGVDHAGLEIQNPNRA